MNGLVRRRLTTGSLTVLSAAAITLAATVPARAATTVAGSSTASAACPRFWNVTRHAISDHDVVESHIRVRNCGSSNGTVRVNLWHSYSADLLITLTSPDGQLYTLHNHGGGSADYTPRNYDIDATEIPVNGEWTLRVADTDDGDSGEITSWSLKFNF